jgi:hypothetical protein
MPPIQVPPSASQTKLPLALDHITVLPMVMGGTRKLSEAWGVGIGKGLGLGIPPMLAIGIAWSTGWCLAPALQNIRMLTPTGRMPRIVGSGPSAYSSS